MGEASGLGPEASRLRIGKRGMTVPPFAANAAAPWPYSMAMRMPLAPFNNRLR